MCLNRTYSLVIHVHVSNAIYMLVHNYTYIVLANVQNIYMKLCKAWFDMSIHLVRSASSHASPTGERISL